MSLRGLGAGPAGSVFAHFLAYDLVVDKGQNGKSYEQLAAERGETVNALTKRVQRFKQKYAPLYRRRREREYSLLVWLRFLQIVAGVAAFAAAVVLLVHWLLGEGPFRRIAPRARSGSVVPARREGPASDDVSHPRPQ